MAIHRYWRLVGVTTLGGVTLDLSEARIYEAGALADAAATLTATIAPASGAVADLRDGSASGVVSWPVANYNAPGFALRWDFGAGLGVDMAQLRLGSGSVADNFALDLRLQYSDDALTWVQFGGVSGITWPGSNALTATPALGDPNFPSVVLLLRSPGVNGGNVFTDASNYARAIGVASSASISNAQSPFGDTSILFPSFDQTIYLYLAANLTDFAFAADFCIEFFLFPISFGATWGSFILDTRNSTLTALSGVGLVFGYAADSNKVGFTLNTTTIKSNAAPVLNQWSHVAVTRISGVVRMFIRGVLQTETVTDASAISASGFLINRAANAASTTGMNAYIEDMRITNGAGLYSATFAPPTLRFPGSLNSPPYAAKHRAGPSQAAQQMLPAVALSDTTAYTPMRETPFFDAQFGGTGTITGTVKEKALPSNTPLARRTLLMDQRSRVIFRETWSDAVTGAYTFPGVKLNTPHTVLAYDHTGTYRAVIADNILATP